NFAQAPKGVPFGSLVRKHPENPVAKSPENLRGASIMLTSRFAPEITRRKPPPMPQTTTSIHSNARASSNLPGCGRIMFHIVGCKIRNAGNVLIVDSFVLIVRGPETDSR